MPVSAVRGLGELQVSSGSKTAYFGSKEVSLTLYLQSRALFLTTAKIDFFHLKHILS